jgi:aldose 1-epimerase
VQQNDPLKQLSISRVTENGLSIAGFSPIGASCTNLSLSGVNLISESAHSDPSIMFFGSVLAPWPNRLRDGEFELEGNSYRIQKLDAQQNANHGLIGSEPLEVRFHEADRIVFGKRFGSAEFPFELDLEIAYSIDEHFKVEASVKNLGKTTAPFAIGFHPYYRVPGSGRVQASVQSHTLADSRMIPFGEEPISGLDLNLPRTETLDDCYRGDWSVILDTEEFSFSVTQKNLPYLMLYQPLDSPFLDGGGGIAIEPMSAPANAFQSEIDNHLLQPGAEKNFSYEIKILS